MKCKICQREEQENRFCQLHMEAYNNVVEKFAVWQRASNMEWIEYLGCIQKNSLTGEWAKEVAKHLIREEEQCLEK